MNIKCALTILFAITIDGGHSVIADKSKFEITKPSQIDQLPDERRLVNFKENPDETKDKHNSETTDSEKDKDSRQEKKTRTILPSTSSTDGADNPRCCGSRYDSSSSSQGSSSGLRINSDAGRYLPSRYGSRPEDRFGWQSYNPGSSGRRGSTSSSSGSGPVGVGGGGVGGVGGLYGGSQSGGDRYGTRPSYYGGGSDYDRPNGNRPMRPSYNYGGSGYGDNGAYGSNGYEISRPGGSYGNRPPSGINFGGGRPGGGGYGGGHGIYGTIGEENEFPGQEEGPEGGPPQHPGVNNLNTQKAVALKALAGVALIGAAAALATNPVLLPIGVLAGRRKRSVISSLQIEEVDANILMKLLEEHVPKIYREKLKPELLESPTCVARLACEIQQRYEDQGENKDNDEISVANVYQRLKTHLGTLIRSKVLDVDILYKNIKRLVKSAAVYDGNCNVFVCDFTKD